MKKFSYAMLLGCVAGAMVLSACNPLKDIPNLVAVKTADFSKVAEIEDFYASHNPLGNGTPFNVGWSKDNVSMENAEMHLKLTKAQEGEDTEYPYWGGEYRSKKFYGYGDYSVEMKPAKLTGTASTFFIYTGEWDSENLHPSAGPNDTRNPDNLEGKHDEIDIEFLGQDTTKVQFNYFVNGVGGHEKMYDLGFDASKEYHTYGFRWEKNRITWFVDLKPVHTVTKNIPTHPGRIIANYWAGDEKAEDWMGKVDDSKLGPEATYKWLGVTVEGKETHKDEGGDPTGPQEYLVNDWSVYQSQAFETGLYGASDGYTVAAQEENKQFDVTYSEIGGGSWKNVWFTAPSYKDDARILSFKVENKGTNNVKVRGNVNATAQHGEHNINIVNTEGRQDGYEVYTDLEWGGSMFSIKPGTTSLCEIAYNDLATKLELMIDSCTDQDPETYAGHVVISEVKFNSSKEPVGPVGPVDPDEPSEWPAVTEGTELAPEETDVYTVNLTDNKLGAKIRYSKIGGQSYEPVNFVIPSDQRENTKASFYIQNMGTETIEARVDLSEAEAHETSGGATTPDVTVSATQDGETIYTNKQWGGSFFSLTGGQKSLIEVKYDGDAVKVQLFLDSSRSEATLRSGLVFFSELKFSEPSGQGGGDDPELPEVTEGEELTILSSGPYNTTLTTNKLGVLAEYENIAGNSYKNIMFDIPEAKRTSRKISFYIQNMGEETVKARVDLSVADENKFVYGSNENGKAVNESATQDGTAITTDLEWSGSKFEIAANQKSLIEVNYYDEAICIQLFLDSSKHDDNTTHNGKVFFSELKFSEPGGNTVHALSEPTVEPLAGKETAELNGLWKSDSFMHLETKNYSIAKVLPNDETSHSVIELGNVDKSSLKAGDILEFRVANYNAQDLFKVSILLRSSTTSGVATVEGGAEMVTGGQLSAHSSSSGQTFKVNANSVAVIRLTLNEDAPKAIRLLPNYGKATENMYMGINHKVVVYKAEGQGGGDDPAAGFNFPSNSVYTVENANGTSHITYASVSDNSYANVCDDNISSLIPEGANTLTFKIKNDGEEKVQFNIALGEWVTDGEGKRNLVSYCVTREDVAYDYFSGSNQPQFNVDAGGEKTVVIAFDNTQNITSIMMFINSFWASEETATTHVNGDVTISNVSFYTVA